VELDVNGLLPVPHMIIERMWNNGGMMLTGEPEGLREKPLTVPFHS
jgi:hypothetical protein